MMCRQRQRTDTRWPAGTSWGLILLALSSSALAGDPTSATKPEPLEQALAAVQDCMSRSPAPWPDAWQREYLDTVRKALAGDPNLPDYPVRIEVFRGGFTRYWAQAQGSGLTQLEYDLRKAEIRWYCETLMSQELASASDKATLKAQLRQLCDYAAQYLRGRFPFLMPKYVDEAKKAAVAMEKVRITLRPIPFRNMSGSSEIADPSTLGRWSAVPEAYRRYWSLRDRSISLRRKPNVREAQRLYADIRSALGGVLPDDVNSPLRELLFRTSAHTGSDEAMRSSARQYFSAYVRLAQEPVERIVIELGRIGQELRARWAEDQTRDFIRPLLKSIVDPKLFADPEFVKEDVLEWIHTQGPTWSWYEQLVRESVQEATGMRLEPAAHIESGSAGPKGPTTIGDSEPDDDTRSAESWKQE